MEKIIFEDLPSTTTPLNAENLNQLQTNAENAINEVDEKINKYIVNHTFTNDTTKTVEFNVEIQPGETIEIEINGGATASNDLNLSINGINAGYYQQGIIYSGSHNSTDGALDGIGGYRADKTSFYYAHALRTSNSLIKGVLYFHEVKKEVHYVWETSCINYGSQLKALCDGILDEQIDEISKITITTGSDGVYFKSGTTIKIKKINN